MRTLPLWTVLVSCTFWSSGSEAQLRPSFSLLPASGCAPLTVKLANTSTSISPTHVLSWDFGDNMGSTAQSPDAVYNSPGTYTITMTVEDANHNLISTKKEVTVYSTPKPDIGPDQRGCWGHPILLSTGLPPMPTVNWTWILGTDVHNNILHGDEIEVNDSGEWVANVQNAAGCSGTDTVNVHYNPYVKARSGDTTVCLGDTVTLKAGIAGPGASYTWIDRIHGKKILSNSYTYSFVASGSQIDLSVVIQQTLNGLTCTDSGACIVKVNTPIHANAGPDESICYGSGVQIGGNNPGASTWKWTSNPTGFHSNMQKPAVSPKTTTVYKLSFDNQFGCISSDSMTVTVNPLPDADWTAGYIGDTAWFQAKDNSQPDSAYLWLFGDGTIAKGPSAKHLYKTNKSYSVTLFVTDASKCVNRSVSTLDITKSGIVPDRQALVSMDVYPNPFQASVNFGYTLAKPSKVVIRLLDITGKPIAQLANENKAAGNYQGSINTIQYNLSPGVYLLEVTTDDGFASRRLVKM